MKIPTSKPIRRLIAVMSAALLTLQLSGCSWSGMPWPIVITDPATTEETSAEALTSEAASTNAPSAAPSENTVAETLPESTDGTVVSTEDGTETAASEASSSDAPPAESTAEETAPVREGFRVDYYRTPDILRRAAGDVILVDAYNLIDAFLAGKTSVSVMSPKEEAGRILYIADTLCPLLKAFTDISEDSWNGGTLSWEFYVGKVEMSIIRAEFEVRVAEYIEPVLSGDYTETERAMLLYHAYTKPASYNYTIISGSFKTYTEAEQHCIHSAYAGIMDHTGVCHDLAGGMTFLFIQAGFNAGRVSVMGGKSEHSWTLIELDGRYTFCDATWDVGGYFSFFGNSVRERTTEKGGSYRANQMDLYNYNAPEHFDIVNPGFKALQDYSYARLQRGLSLTLTIDTKVSPHRIIVSTGENDRITMTTP